MTEPFKPSDEHPTLAHYVWFEKWKFCGCGSSDTVLGHVKVAMRALKDQSERWRSSPAFGGWTPDDQAKSDATNMLIGGGEKFGPLYYMTAYLLDAADLTEHGGSVPGWLTDQGEALLAYLEATPEDDWLSDELSEREQAGP